MLDGQNLGRLSKKLNNVPHLVEIKLDSEGGFYKDLLSPRMILISQISTYQFPLLPAQPMASRPSDGRRWRKPGQRVAAALAPERSDPVLPSGHSSQATGHDFIVFRAKSQEAQADVQLRRFALLTLPRVCWL